MNCKVGFIGCGNMGGALLHCACETVAGNEIMICDRDENKIKDLCEKYGVLPGSADEVVSNCKFIFLGVKPQHLQNLLHEIKDSIAARTDEFVLVSMAASVSIESISNMLSLKKTCPIIRIMPNLPVCVGEGMIIYSLNGHVKNSQSDEFEEILNKAGTLDRIDEGLIDAASAITGCGPAFVYMFIQSMADGGVKCGLSRDKALLYASKTVLGSAKHVISSKIHPEVLKDAVCSPGGTTIDGVCTLEKFSFRSGVASAVEASYEKTCKLAGKNKK